MTDRLEARIGTSVPGLGSRWLLLGLVIGIPLAAQEQVLEVSRPSDYCTVFKVKTASGAMLDRTVIRGPRTPPPGFELERQTASLPRSSEAAGINTLVVPAFNWVFGCSSVSGAMIAAYYDRTGYPSMYLGPTNGGLMPLDNSSWPTWSDGHDTYPSCPLIASRAGVDGRVPRGSIDDYWIQYGSTANDPYVTGSWTQHAWGTAIGDYMKTSQSAYGNTDGSTSFYNYTNSPNPLTASAMETGGIASLDGTYGRKLFYEARGYVVTDCYNQLTDNKIAGGFSFTQYKAEIDAGRPVMLNLVGHTVVGVGYDDSTSTVYIHDTWDYSNHTMTWGGSYSGMALNSVSIVNLASPPASPTLTSFTPTSAPVGTVLTLSGSNFTGTSSVTFNGTAATTFHVDGASQISVTVPAGATTGPIVVTTPGGTAQSSFSFTVITYDLNADGSIDLKDLARIARTFGTSRASDPTGFQAQYDLNGDGVINEDDATILFNHLQ